MNSQNGKIRLFDYSDYRAFLRDWVHQEKQTRRAFSYRIFSKRAGFETSNFLMLVMQGKRNLTEESLQKCVLGLKLNKQEQDFFRNLVFYNQAKTHEDKNSYYQHLLQSKKYQQIKPIEKKQYEYYSSWYHPVIRELVVSKDFDGTPEWLANRLSPAITPAQAAKSIELLESLGFIQHNGDHRWKQSDHVITTGPTLISTVVHNYHKQMLGLTLEVMDQVSMPDRDVSTMTLGIKRERLEELKTKIREFRQEILKLVSGDTEPEEVAQLNIQFFPVTNQRGKS